MIFNLKLLYFPARLSARTKSAVKLAGRPDRLENTGRIENCLNWQHVANKILLRIMAPNWYSVLGTARVADPLPMTIRLHRCRRLSSANSSGMSHFYYYEIIHNPVRWCWCFFLFFCFLNADLRCECCAEEFVEKYDVLDADYLCMCKHLGCLIWISFNLKILFTRLRLGRILLNFSF